MDRNLYLEEIICLFYFLKLYVFFPGGLGGIKWEASMLGYKNQGSEICCTCTIGIINKMHPLFFMADVWSLTTGQETQPGIREVTGNKSPNTSNCTSRLYLRRNLIA